MIIDVNVKQRFIDSSVERCPTACMVADAVVEALADFGRFQASVAPDIFIKATSITVRRLNEDDKVISREYVEVNDKHVLENIILFDQGKRKEISEFSFPIELDDDFLGVEKAEMPESELAHV